MMLSNKLIAERLKRFEVLSGMKYVEPEMVFHIWKEKAKNLTDEQFNICCDYIEDKELTWHILPTPKSLCTALSKKYTWRA